MFDTYIEPSPGETGAGAPRWHTEAGGLDLAGALVGLDVESLSDFETVEAVAAWGRLASWAQAAQARAAAELSRREAMQMDARWAPDSSEVRISAHELSLRLGTTRQAATRLVRLGRAFDGVCAATGEVLAAGNIDLGKATDIVTHLEGVRWDIALGAQDLVLPEAPRLTRRQLAKKLQAALMDLDPHAAAELHEAAVERRYVSAPAVAPDGMAKMWLLLPAPDAVALHGALDVAARTARRDGDPRTLDQLRADALYGAVVRCGQHAGAGAARPPDLVLAERATTCTGAPHVRVVVPLDTLIGDEDSPAELDGYGPIPATTARAIARGGTWRRLVTDPLEGTVLDVGTARYRPPADLAEHVRTRDGTCVSPTCSVPATRCDLDHVTPHPTRTNAPEGDHPCPDCGDRNGYDDDARAGCGHTGDPTPGATRADNLASLSRMCHLDKTHGGFGLEQPEPGLFVWTTPTGHRYEYQPDGLPTGGARWRAARDEARLSVELEPDENDDESTDGTTEGSTANGTDTPAPPGQDTPAPGTDHEPRDHGSTTSLTMPPPHPRRVDPGKPPY